MRLAILAAVLMTKAFGQVVVTDTGSTNRMGMSITMGSRGHALIENRAGTKVKMKLASQLHTRLMKDLEAAGPLDRLQVQHCAKSISFGSSTFITYKGVRSPDLSCSGQADPVAAALQKDLEEIMTAAHVLVPVASRRPPPR